MVIEGVAGAEIDIVGVSGRFIEGIRGGSGRLMVGTAGEESGKLITGIEIDARFTWIEGVSGS